MKCAIPLAAAALLFLGCAPGPAPGSSPGSDRVLAVEVRNNYPTAVSREIHISEGGGSTRPVGQVPASATRRLDVRSVDWSAQHVLFAESLTGGVIQSAPFFANPGGGVLWDLARNRIEVIEP